MQIRNGFSVDVEDYFQVAAFESVISQDDWPKYELRVEKNTEKILEILDQFNVKGTFFILGWVAQKSPNLVKKIDQLGHEVACHGFAHQLIYRYSKDYFQEDIHKAKVILENITGKPVYGYRAPSYSIVNSTFWALDILKEEGFAYDSSIFPIRHDRYGIAGFSRFPTKIDLENGSQIMELPPSTTHLFGQNFPIAGGGYFRIFPYLWFQKGIARVNQKEKQPVIFYLHPWEVDPEQPRVTGASLLSRFRHYHNLDKTEHRLKRLLQDFSFGRLCDLLEEVFGWKLAA